MKLAKISGYSHGTVVLLVLSTISWRTALSTEKGKGTMADWGEWGGWSSCTKPCGIGISTRYRVCGDAKDSGSDRGKMKTNCVGEYRQYRTCNLLKCPKGTKDFRQLQCERFNSRVVAGRRYTWEPFYNGGNKCELSCRAKGQTFYAKMSSVVMDGTACDPTDPYHICINGQCQKVGCDGVLGSDKTLDKCGVCGGHDTTCHIISGIFTRAKLPYGYNHVARIPKGACNVNITELHPSTNYLALRESHGKYIVNGNWDMGYSKEYEGAGSVIRYHRPAVGDVQNPLEYIFIEGPTNISLDVLVVRQTDNRGIMYSFTIPMDKQSHDNNSHKNKGSDEIVPENPQYIAPNSDRLNYKTAPKYVKPEYDNERFEQTLASNDGESSRPDSGYGDLSSQDYQRDSYNSARYKQYMDQLRQQQRQRSEQRKRRHHHQQGQESRTGSRSEKTANANNSRRAYGPTVKTYNRPSASQTQSSAPIRRQYGSQYGQAEGTQGVQHYGNQRGSGYAYPSGSQQTGDTYSRVYPQRGYPSSASRVNTADTNRRYSATYDDTRPQPGVNYGLQRGQQPLPQVDGTGYQGQVYRPQHRTRYQYLSSRGSSYLNVNQQPVYIPPSYQNQGVQGLQTGQQYDRGSYPSYQQGSATGSVQLGTLDTSSEYSWKISGFTECSRTCGEGTQTTIIVCVKVDSQAVVTDNNCDGNKPVLTSVTCNDHPCPAGWIVGSWGACTTSCGRGTRSRTVECKQRISSTLEISVSASRCAHERRPDSQQICNDDRPCVMWRIGDWGKCSAECGRGQRARQVLCVDAAGVPVTDNKCKNLPKPAAAEICDMGSCAKTWFFTEWTTECSNTCGEGVYRRAVYCAADECSAITKPDTITACENKIPCGGTWFVGPWTECSVSCGQGVEMRDATCMKKRGRSLIVVGEENCLAEAKPALTQPCETTPCFPEWFMTEWTECSRECNTGTQTREVKCLTTDQEISTSCSQATKPEVRQACNTHPCTHEGRAYRPVQAAPGCEDDFKNCHLVVQARLCQYNYYKSRCCVSCTEYERLHPAES